MTTPIFRFAALAACCTLLAACSTLNSVDPFAESEPPPPQSAVTAPAAQPLMGMNAADLRVAIGAPAFVRKDGADQMWRYDTAGCKAFFFLYPQGSDLAVRHVETLPQGKSEAADPACLNALRGRAFAAGFLTAFFVAAFFFAGFTGADFFGSGASRVLSLKRHRSRSTQVGQCGLRAVQV